MGFTFFNPQDANNLAKFQGTYAGIQAGNAYYGGVATAPTSIYNQAGYYALQDTDSGEIKIKKLADDSLFTHKWYDQTSGNQFDVSGSKKSFELTDLSRNMTPDQIASLDANA